jgi:hypothetical protein
MKPSPLLTLTAALLAVAPLTAVRGADGAAPAAVTGGSTPTAVTGIRATDGGLVVTAQVPPGERRA